MVDLNHIAEYMSSIEPINGPWTEKRWAFRMNGNTYIIDDCIPGWNRYNPNHKPSGIGWTVGEVIQWLKRIGIEPFLMEVEVKEK